MAGKRVLMVEGKDDEHVVKHICGQRGLGQIDRIDDCHGKDRLLESIPTRVKESDLIALGILLDADTDLLARWHAVIHRLKTAGYVDLPDEPARDGTIVEPPSADSLLPRVGIWLMPDNQVPGILEDFLNFLVPSDNPLRAHAEQSIDNIPNDQVRFTELAKPKATIHTWLAWQEEPGMPLGLAIKARYLDSTLPAANGFANWLKRTFFS